MLQIFFLDQDLPLNHFLPWPVPKIRYKKVTVYYELINEISLYIIKIFRRHRHRIKNREGGGSGPDFSKSPPPPPPPRPDYSNQNF